MDLGYLPDIARAGVLDIEEMPDRAKEVLALRAIGLSTGKIGRIVKIKKTSVEDYLRRYDPDGLCRVTPEQKRVITTEMLMGVGVEALTEITDAKLRASDAKELAQIAARCVGTAEKIRALDKGIKDRKTELDSAMDYLDMADVEEVE